MCTGGDGSLGGNSADLTKAALEEASALDAVVSWYRDVQRQQIDEGLAGDPVMFPPAPGHSRGGTGISSPTGQSKAASVLSADSSRPAAPPGQSIGKPLVSPEASRSAAAASDSGGEQSSWLVQGRVMAGTSLQSTGDTTVQVCCSISNMLLHNTVLVIRWLPLPEGRSRLSHVEFPAGAVASCCCSTTGQPPMYARLTSDTSLVLFRTLRFPICQNYHE